MRRAILAAILLSLNGCSGLMTPDYTRNIARGPHQVYEAFADFGDELSEAAGKETIDNLVTVEKIPDSDVNLTVARLGKFRMKFEQVDGDGNSTRVSVYLSPLLSMGGTGMRSGLKEFIDAAAESIERNGYIPSNQSYLRSPPDPDSTRQEEQWAARRAQEQATAPTVDPDAAAREYMHQH